jgi:hypothetical protein
MRIHTPGITRPLETEVRFSGKRSGLLAAAFMSASLVAGGVGCNLGTSTQVTPAGKSASADNTPKTGKAEAAEKPAPLTEAQLTELRSSVQNSEINLLARSKKRGEAVHRLVDYLNQKAQKLDKVDVGMKAALAEMSKTFSQREEALKSTGLTNEIIWRAEKQPFTATQKTALSAYIQDVSLEGSRRINALFSSKDTSKDSVKALMDDDFTRMDLSSDAISWRVACYGIAYKLERDVKELDEKAVGKPYESLVGGDNFRQIMTQLMKKN